MRSGRDRTSRSAVDLVAFATDDPVEMRKRVCDAVYQLAHADVAGFYSIADLEAGSVLTNLCVRGNAMAPAIEALVSRPGFLSPFLDVRRPPPIQTRAFVESAALFGPGVLQRSEFFQCNLAPAGVGDQTRLLIYDGDEFVGLISALRRDGGAASRFERRDRSRLHHLVGPVVNALVTAHRLERRGVPGSTCFLIVRPSGKIEYIGPERAQWLERRDLLACISGEVRRLNRNESAADPADRMLGAFRCRIMRLEGSATRYLVSLAAAPSARQARDWKLSPSERRVCELAAAGANVREIALHLGRSPNTVQTQLRSAYDKLGVSSRIELVRALEDAAGADALSYFS